MILIATTEGLHLFESGDNRRVDELAGREIRGLASGEGGWHALVEGRELWRSAEGRHWLLAAAVPQRRKATCVGVTPAGLLVGTARAHLLRLDRDQLVAVPAFDQAEGRGSWYTPWGAPADVRSIGAAAGFVYVNVHVGGVLRSTDGGDTWQPTLDIEHDVHQVLVPAELPDVVLVAAFDGFGRSDDGGDTWSWDNEGMHAHYCRAVALAGDTVIVSASAGHHGRRAAVYRRRLGERVPFERCRHGLPEWFSDNVDTGCLAASGHIVVIGTEDGSVFRSSDAGDHWETVAKGLAPIRAVALG
jgi:photosystem II stability/assembly factor-like uncharacterized protein